TTFCDMYFYEDDVAAVVDELGARGVLGQAFFDFTGPQGLSVDQNVAYAKRFVERWRGHPRIVPALAPHATYNVGPELYRTLLAPTTRYTSGPDPDRTLKALADTPDDPLVTHPAETKDEDRDIRARYGRSPVRHLAELGLLGERLVAAHCVWVDREEIELLAA